MISVSNVNIILILLKPRAQSRYFLQRYFFEIGLTSTGNNTRPKSNAIEAFLSYKTNLNLF